MDYGYSETSLKVQRFAFARSAPDPNKHRVRICPMKYGNWSFRRERRFHGSRSRKYHYCGRNNLAHPRPLIYGGAMAVIYDVPSLTAFPTWPKARATVHFFDLRRAGSLSKAKNVVPVSNDTDFALGTQVLDLEWRAGSLID